MIRVLKMTKNSAVKAQTQARNQLKALLVTAPEELRYALSGLSARALIERCAAFRGLGDDLQAAPPTTTTVAKQALRVLARRVLVLRAEIKEAERQLRHLTTAACPALTDTFGVGPDCAAALLVTAGDNPERLHSEAAFAALCGVNPIPAAPARPTRTDSTAAATGRPTRRCTASSGVRPLLRTGTLSRPDHAAASRGCRACRCSNSAGLR